MKKVVATLIVKDNEIINLTVNDNKGGGSTLTPTQKRFNNINEIYNCALKILKNNNFYTHSYKEFGRVWYNIQLIDLNNPATTYIYGIDETSN